MLCVSVTRGYGFFLSLFCKLKAVPINSVSLIFNFFFCCGFVCLCGGGVRVKYSFSSLDTTEMGFEMWRLLKMSICLHNSAHLYFFFRLDM